MNDGEINLVFRPLCKLWLYQCDRKFGTHCAIWIHFVGYLKYLRESEHSGEFRLKVLI